MADPPADLRADSGADSVSQPNRPTPRVPLLINGEPASWDDLRPSLGELAGARAIEELILDRALEAEFRARGWSLGDDDIEAERANFFAALAASPDADPAELGAELRREMGLGDSRFPRLLERNARLRRLAGESVSPVGDADIERLYAVRHGPSARVRLLMAPTDREASRAHAELAGQDPASLSSRFAALAAERSIDASASRGGLLDPISPADPAYPDAVVRAIAALEPGVLSPVIALDRGYAIILLEERVAPTGTPIEAVRDSLRAELARRVQRLEMDRIARRMLEQSAVTVLDPSLNWSWESRPR